MQNSIKNAGEVLRLSSTMQWEKRKQKKSQQGWAKNPALNQYDHIVDLTAYDVLNPLLWITILKSPKVELQLLPADEFIVVT
jgi:hypothetical protein